MTRASDYGLPLSERMALCGKRVKLNGQPATISGYQHRFARVTQRASRLGCEFAWETVARIVAAGGEFQS